MANNNSFDTSIGTVGAGNAIPNLPVTLSNVLVHEFTGPGSVDFVCRQLGLPSAVAARRATITAIKIDNLTRTG
jgi:hypothetical protein